VYRGKKNISLSIKPFVDLNYYNAQERYNQLVSLNFKYKYRKSEYRIEYLREIFNNFGLVDSVIVEKINKYNEILLCFRRFRRLISFKLFSEGHGLLI
jgi:hypothetical protein